MANDPATTGQAAETATKQTVETTNDALEIIRIIGEQSKLLIKTQPILGYFVLGLAAIVLIAIAWAIIRMLFKDKSMDRIAGFVFEVGADGQGGKPSVSRLQMLIWNFVVAFAFLYVLGTRENLLAAIHALFQWQVLALLGISNGTYLFGKRVKQGSATPQAGTPDTITERGGQPVAAGEATATGPGPQGTQ